MAQTTQTRALRALGYSLVAITNHPALFPDTVASDPDSMAEVLRILTDISEVDIALADGIADSMAEQVQDIKVDYGRFISQTMAKGKRLIQELSNAIGTPVMYNKYGSTYNATAVRNYY